MLQSLIRRVVGSANDRYLKKLQKDVVAINALEPEMEALSDEELKAKTVEFRARLENGEDLDDLLQEAFAVVREASKRTLGLRHYDVQLVAGIVLHQGMIAEAKTGEGKTLTATLPIYLNALTGDGAHVVTVNDYLAQRDAEEMGKVYGFLGMTTGCISQGMGLPEDAPYEQVKAARRAAYACDVTYGTNNEIGFDFLRDNMEHRKADMVQRGFHYGIVDEVDSILIDEARTPLIISGPSDDSGTLYQAVDSMMKGLKPEHYEKDEKQRTVIFTDEGLEFVEAQMYEQGLLEEGQSLFDAAAITMLHHANSALRAHAMLEKDVHYMVRKNEVVLIDEFTGRAMSGRRLSEGLHQALEAKEGVTVQRENITVASITFQNLFRSYDVLAGMTGTAATEADEFLDIYGLDVVEIPTNEPVARLDQDDEVYRTFEEKVAAIINKIEECHAKNQPVLVGTVSIEKSELFAERLKKRGIPHKVLNARYHEQEAQIVADAGRPGAVTIATNMAGRGTDIQLGGNLDLRLRQGLEGVEDEAERQRITDSIKAEIAEAKQIVKDAGGLFVLGTERHESRRIDNQLRGRSGRQGDPGESRFYLCLTDDLMRIFGSERLDGMLKRLGLEEGEAIVHPWINKAVEKAQKKVEERNFEIRKHVVKFDNVMNDQRKVVFEQRLDIMDAEEVVDTVREMREQAITSLVQAYIPPGSYPDQWDAPGLRQALIDKLRIELPVDEWVKEEGVADEELIKRIEDIFNRVMAEKAVAIGPETMRYVEKSLLLQLFDQNWREHLQKLIQLRDGVGLRAYGQRNPLDEYKREAFGLFEEMLTNLRFTVTAYLLNVQVQTAEQQAAAERAREQAPADSEQVAGEAQTGDAAQADGAEDWGKVPRNAPCPCGSGKKFKHCHGALS